MLTLTNLKFTKQGATYVATVDVAGNVSGKVSFGLGVMNAEGMAVNDLKHAPVQGGQASATFTPIGTWAMHDCGVLLMARAKEKPGAKFTVVRSKGLTLDGSGNVQS